MNSSSLQPPLKTSGNSQNRSLNFNDQVEKRKITSRPRRHPTGAQTSTSSTLSFNTCTSMGEASGHGAPLLQMIHGGSGRDGGGAVRLFNQWNDTLTK
jgi:hypothetical protein